MKSPIAFGSRAFTRGLLPGLLGVALCGAASANTITIDPGGSGDYLTIQAGIDNALAGDTILVLAGTYVENLIIPVSVTISGAGIGQSVVLPATSIPGAGNGSQVGATTWMARIQADGVVLSGLTFDGDNPAFPAPIDARGGIITDYSAGTFNGAQINGCEVTNVVYRGIYLAAGGTGHSVVSNTVSNVDGIFLDSVGIFFFGAVGDASTNVVSNCSIGIGFQSGGGGSITGNDINSCDLGVLSNASTSPVSLAGNTIAGFGQGLQVIAADTLVDVDGNDTLGCSSGLTLFGLGSGSISADGNTFDGNNELNSYGIFASTDASPWGFANLTFVATNNLLTRNEIGVVLDESLTDLSPVLSAVLSGSNGAHNTFTANVSFNVALENCDDDVDASFNAWGAVNSALIESSIHHQVDDPVLGLVDFSNAQGSLITVDDDGPADFATINPAVQALLPGGTIQVMPGLYVEDVLVDRSCLIQGSGTDSDPALGTVLRGASLGADMTVVEVTGQDVFIDDLRVDGVHAVFPHAARGIFGNATSGLNVTNCIVHTARTAIDYVSSTGGVFLSNEVFDFGESLNVGAGIYLSGSTGTVGVLGQGNLVHDGLSPAISFVNGSGGAAHDNVAQNSAIGFVSHNAAAATLFEDNSSKNCNQGYQSIGNQAPVTYTGNDAKNGLAGYVQFGLGGQLHAYTGNRVFGCQQGWVITTESSSGDDDAVATLEGNVATECQVGVVLAETLSSNAFTMDVNLNGLNAANWFQGNSVRDIQLNGCNDNFDARNNYFGSTDLAQIEIQIKHQPDDPVLGVVTFTSPQPSFAYCEGKLTSSGCLPSIGSTGICSATSGLPFNVTATQVQRSKNGLLFYGLGRREIPFQGGKLCIASPLYRTGVQNSGGALPDNCSGNYSFNMNALIQGGNNPVLTVGSSVYAQFWFRDPPLGPPNPIGLSNALTFHIAP